ncbi:MAG TPA: hypothetical protein VF477_03160, partial [Mycobacterium sp.]
MPQHAVSKTWFMRNIGAGQRVHGELSESAMSSRRIYGQKRIRRRRKKLKPSGNNRFRFSVRTADPP